MLEADEPKDQNCCQSALLETEVKALDIKNDRKAGAE
jgi:hypothetical protein